MVQGDLACSLPRASGNFVYPIYLNRRVETHDVKSSTSSQSRRVSVLVPRIGISRGEGDRMFPPLDSTPGYRLSVPTIATRLWSSLRTRGNVVRELDGRERRSMIAAALKETGR